MMMDSHLFDADLKNNENIYICIFSIEILFQVEEEWCVSVCFTLHI